jgi:hypothetical protein
MEFHMTSEELFLKEGADYFGNRLIYRNQDVGEKFPGGDLLLNDHGVEVAKVLSSITDVEAKEPKAKRKYTPKGDIDLAAELNDLVAPAAEQA